MTKFIIVKSLQRSGIHAVLNWITSLFPHHCFYNNQHHALFLDNNRVRKLLADSDYVPCVIISFEDDARRMRGHSNLLVGDVAPFPANLSTNIDIFNLSILRDPYNTWASRVAGHSRTAREGEALTCDPSWELFRENWLSIARIHRTSPKKVILYDDWRVSKEYRREICRFLGGTYSERTLNDLLAYGGGSSFDGPSRPSYSKIVKNIGRYSSEKFLVHFRRNPRKYIRRLISRPVKASTMRVDDRWRFLVGRSEGRMMLEDEEIRGESQRIFGFAISSDGSSIIRNSE